MLIKKIKLHNIRSYNDEEIVFPTGSVLLSGDIGCGKSTILLAIEFALFGGDAERLSGTALLRNGTAECHVELVMDVDGKEITIKRGMKKSRNAIGQTPGSLVMDGKRKDAMPIELKSDIISLLGYPEELVTKKRNLIYRYTVYCPQEEMKSILVDEQESRLDTLRKIFGVDKYKRIRENCMIVLRELKSTQKEMEARIEGLDEKKKQQAETNERLGQIHERLAALVPLIQQLEDEIATKKEAVKKAEREVLVLQESKKRLSVLETQRKIKEELAEKSEAKIRAIRATVGPEGVGDDIATLQTEIERRGKEVQTTITQKSVLRQKRESTEQRIAETEKELSHDVSPRLQKIEEDVQAVERELAEKEVVVVKKGELERHLENARGILAEYKTKKVQAEETKAKILELALCPTCLQTVSKEHKEKVHQREQERWAFFDKKMCEYGGVVKQKEAELLQLRNRQDYFTEQERRLAALRADISHLEVQKNALELKKSVLVELQRQRGQIIVELGKVEHIAVEQELRDINGLKERLEKARAKERLVKELQEVTDARTRLLDEVSQLVREKGLVERHIISFEGVEERLSALRETLDKLVEEERSFSIERARWLTEKKASEDMMLALTREIEEKERIKGRIMNAKRLTHWLDEYFVHLMSTMEKHVMMRIYHEFNELFRNWFSMLIADEGMSARVDDSFNPVIEQNGYEVDVGYLSGGERTSAALAYRLALNKVVNDVIHTIKTKDILILDEPTDGFSSEQLDRVREVLDQLGVEQVIIVSHENKIESFVDNVIRIGKEEGVSRVLS